MIDSDRCLDEFAVVSRCHRFALCWIKWRFSVKILNKLCQHWTVIKFYRRTTIIFGRANGSSDIAMYFAEIIPQHSLAIPTRAFPRYIAVGMRWKAIENDWRWIQIGEAINMLISLEATEFNLTGVHSSVEAKVTESSYGSLIHRKLPHNWAHLRESRNAFQFSRTPCVANDPSSSHLIYHNIHFHSSATRIQLKLFSRMWRVSYARNMSRLNDRKCDDEKLEELYLVGDDDGKIPIRLFRKHVVESTVGRLLLSFKGGIEPRWVISFDICRNGRDEKCAPRQTTVESTSHRTRWFVLQSISARRTPDSICDIPYHFSRNAMKASRDAPWNQVLLIIICSLLELKPYDKLMCKVCRGEKLVIRSKLSHFLEVL